MRIRQLRRSNERDEQALNNIQYSPASRGCNRSVAASKTYIIIATEVYGQSRNGFY